MPELPTTNDELLQAARQVVAGINANATLWVNPPIATGTQTTDANNLWAAKEATGEHVFGPRHAASFTLERPSLALKLFLICSFACICLSCSDSDTLGGSTGNASSKPLGGLVRARVLDLFGNPVNQAAIMVENLETSSSSKDGKFEVHLTPGSYRIYGTAPGHRESGRVEVQILDGTQLEMKPFLLLPRPENPGVYKLEASGLKPLPSATLDEREDSDKFKPVFSLVNTDHVKKQGFSSGYCVLLMYGTELFSIHNERADDRQKNQKFLYGTLNTSHRLSLVSLDGNALSIERFPLKLPAIDRPFIKLDGETVLFVSENLPSGDYAVVDPTPGSDVFSGGNTPTPSFNSDEPVYYFHASGPPATPTDEALRLLPSTVTVEGRKKLCEMLVPGFDSSTYTEFTEP